MLRSAWRAGPLLALRGTVGQVPGDELPASGARDMPFPTMNAKLYDELASWWPLVSSPDEYREEAEFYGRQLRAAGDQPAKSFLELGSGGGNNASHLKAGFDMVLVDPSSGMLDVSRELNPECEHLIGDMRTARLGRQFDRVFIHDAICYMTTKEDLRSAIATAFAHCRPGGAALFAPDNVRENFKPLTDHGGNDGEVRAMRYVEWAWDPDPEDSTYTVDYAFVLRESDGSVRLEHDRHIEGLFLREEWLTLLTEAGFEPRVVPFDHSELDPGSYEVFVGVRPSQ